MNLFLHYNSFDSAVSWLEFQGHLNLAFLSAKFDIYPHRNKKKTLNVSNLNVKIQDFIWDKWALRINAYFEEHDVTAGFVIPIIRVLVFLHNSSHCPSVSEIVGAQNNPHQWAAKS